MEQAHAAARRNQDAEVGQCRFVQRIKAARNRQPKFGTTRSSVW
jgi:hypothetical protein